MKRERRPSESKAIGEPLEFIGKRLREFAESFGMFVMMTRQTDANGRVKCKLFLQCCKTKYLEKQVKQILIRSAMFTDVLVALERQYPCYESDLSIKTDIENLGMLPNNPKAAWISKFLVDLGHWVRVWQ